MGSLYGAWAVRGLAPRAPEQVAGGEHLGADRPLADQARLTGAAVDVDLPAVVVAPRRPAHRLGRVLGPHGVDPTGADAVAHQPAEVLPDRLERPAPDGVAGAERVHAVPEEHLGAVD